MQDPKDPKDTDQFDEFEDFGEFDDFGDDLGGEPAPGSDADDGMLMPEDDFTALSDDTMTAADELESAAFAGGEWDDINIYEENWATPEENAQAYKSGGLKSLSFNTIVIGIAVIVGLGVLGYQVMTSGGGGSGLSRFQSALNFTGSTDGPVLGRTEEAPADAADMASVTDTENPDGGFLSNPDMLGAIEQESGQDGGLPMPAPISNTIDDQGVETAQSGADDILTPLPSISAETPSQLAFEEAQPMPRGPSDPVPASPVSNNNEPAEDLATGEQEAPSSALDVIRKAQQQQEQKQAAVNETQTEPVSAVSATQSKPVNEPIKEEPVVAETSEVASASKTAPAEVEALKGTLKEMTAQVSAMEQEMDELREQARSEKEALQKEIAALKQAAIEKPASSTQESKPKTEKKTTAPSAAAPPATSAAPRPTQSASPAVTWELRAAQPGRAWVSRKGQREMQTIEVGSTLSGIGRVTRIDYADGRWTVYGTQGRIDQ